MKLSELLQGIVECPKEKSLDDIVYVEGGNLTKEEEDLLEHWDNGYNQSLTEILFVCLMPFPSSIVIV